MKVLIVNTYAEIRSTGKISHLLYDYLKSKGHEVRFCYRGTRQPTILNEDFKALDNILWSYTAAFMTRLTGYDGIWNYISTANLIKEIKQFKPDVVHIYCVHSFYLNYYKLFEFLNKEKIPVLYNLIDEFAYTGKCCFAYDCPGFKNECGNCPQVNVYPESWFFDRSKKQFRKKQKSYGDLSNIIFAGTEWVCNRAKESSMLQKAHVEVLDEPINYNDIFYPHDYTKLREDLKIPKQNKVILSVADMKYVRKGGIYFLKLAELFKENPDYTFIIVGYVDVGYPTYNNLIKIPFVESQHTLATYYSMADLFVCTSLSETVPDACLDALGCGTPLAGFAETGTPLCADYPIGNFTKTFDLLALKDVILLTPNKTSHISQKCINYAHMRYKPEVVFGKLMKIYNKLLK